MGEDKGSLVLGGVTLLERAVSALGAVADEVVVVRAPGQALPLVQTSGSLVVVSDPVAGAGPLEGIATGLEVSGSAVVVVVGVDHPFLRPALLRLLVERVRGGVAWALPVADGHPQPMCSALSRAALPGIRAALSGGQHSPISVARSLGAVLIEEREWRGADPDGLSFQDVDTPEAFEAAVRYLEGAYLEGTGH